MNQFPGTDLFLCLQLNVHVSASVAVNKPCCIAISGLSDYHRINIQITGLMMCPVADKPLNFRSRNGHQKSGKHSITCHTSVHIDGRWTLTFVVVVVVVVVVARIYSCFHGFSQWELAKYDCRFLILDPSPNNIQKC